MNLHALVSIVAGIVTGFSVFAHPSSGLVVTDKGEVFFVHSGKGVAKIERDGKLIYVKLRALSYSRKQRRES